MIRHITYDPKVRFGIKLCFEASMGHLRSFDVSKLKSDKSNQLSIQKKPTVRHIYQMPQSEI